jgi:hypothetical protein
MSFFTGKNMKSQSAVSHDFFINCRSPESAYLLGFLWGDGYLYDRSFVEKRKTKKGISSYNKHSYHIKVECSEDDLSLLIPIFTQSGKWTSYRRTRKGRKPQLCLSTANKKLYDFLSEYNYQIKSGAYPEILRVIPKEFVHYWWRGYFDADGCIYKIKRTGKSRQVSISSVYEQDWTATSDLLGVLGVKYSIRRVIRSEKSKYSEIRFTSNKSTEIFLEYIYSGKEFGLMRKKEIYLKSKYSNSASEINRVPSISVVKD